MTQNFSFKPDESDQILKSLLIEEIKRQVDLNSFGGYVNNSLNSPVLCLEMPFNFLSTTEQHVTPSTTKRIRNCGVT